MRKQALMLTKSSFVTAAPPQLLVRARWHLGQGRHSADLEEKALRTSGASNNQFAEVVTGFEHLRAAGKIRAWGVSRTSQFGKWKIFSAFQVEIVAQPIRSRTASATVESSVICRPGASKRSRGA